MKILCKNAWIVFKFLVLLLSFSEEVGKTLMPMGIKICSSNYPKRYSIEKQAAAKSSIRTRIKTTRAVAKKDLFMSPNHPLEQGLRRSLLLERVARRWVAKSSIRTRIKTSPDRYDELTKKPPNHPLKQGLRRIVGISSGSSSFAATSSIRTRIKTNNWRNNHVDR